MHTSVHEAMSGKMQTQHALKTTKNDARQYDATQTSPTSQLTFDDFRHGQQPACVGVAASERVLLCRRQPQTR